MAKDEEKVKIDPMNLLFAKAMESLTFIGLVFMVIPGLLYFGGVRRFVDVHTVVDNWDKPAPDFWQSTRGIDVHGYSWFLGHASYMDCLSIIGILLLGLIPLFSMGASLTKANNTYRIILGILVFEFLFAIVRPLFMGGGG